MNQSDLRVDGLPNVAAVWVDYFLSVIVKRKQTVSDPITNNGKLGRHLGANLKSWLRTRTVRTRLDDWTKNLHNPIIF